MRDQYGHVGFYIRSSFNFEDLTEKATSGHYDSYPDETFLDTSTNERILKAIKMAFASMWNEIAFRTRVENRIKDQDVLAAVIVQVPIKALFAGTMYTASPYSYSFNEIDIMASPGQGAAVENIWQKAEEILAHLYISKIGQSTQSHGLAQNPPEQYKQETITLTRLQTAPARVITIDLVGLTANKKETVSLHLKDIATQEDCLDNGGQSLADVKYKYIKQHAQVRISFIEGRANIEEVIERGDLEPKQEPILQQRLNEMLA
ncbi:unnamed protein product, partial [marine sediment metagenome]